MERLRLVELIENQISKLSAEGRAIWEEAELTIQVSNTGQDVTSVLTETLQKTTQLSESDKIIFAGLFDLMIGLTKADMEDSDGEDGGTTRMNYVVWAAIQKDMLEDSNVMLDRAIARLEDG